MFSEKLQFISEEIYIKGEPENEKVGWMYASYFFSLIKIIYIFNFDESRALGMGSVLVGRNSSWNSKIV